MSAASLCDLYISPQLGGIPLHTPDHHVNPDSESDAPPDAATTPLHTAEQLQQQIHERDLELQSLRRDVAVTQALAATPVVDMDAARILVNHTLAQDDTSSAEHVVQSLQREKPFLFRPTPAPRAHGATAPQSLPQHTPADRAVEQLDSAASDARSTGRVPDLMRYLRLRRSM